MNRPSVTLTSLRPRSRMATTSMRIAIEVRPVRYEAEFALDDDERFDPRTAPRQRRDGRPLWTTTVPANGTATYRYRLYDVAAAN